MVLSMRSRHITLSTPGAEVKYRNSFCVRPVTVSFEWAAGDGTLREGPWPEMPARKAAAGIPDYSTVPNL